MREVTDDPLPPEHLDDGPLVHCARDGFREAAWCDECRGVQEIIEERDRLAGGGIGGARL